MCGSRRQHQRSLASRIRESHGASKAAQHLQVFGFEGRGDALAQDLRETLIAVEHGKQIKAIGAGILEIVNGLGRNHHKVAGVGCDRAFLDVEDHRAPQHEIKLRGVVVGVQRHPVAGIVDFQKQADPFLGSAVVITIGG